MRVSGRLAAGDDAVLEHGSVAEISAEPGSHWGVVTVTTGTLPGENGAAIRVKIGVILLVDVWGEVKEEMSVADFSLPRVSWGFPLPVTVRFANTGTARERPRGTLSIVNMFGKTAATLALPGENVLPGTVRRIDLAIGKGLWAGRYTARLAATYGQQNQIPLSFETQFWFVDWKNIGLPFLILGGTFLFLISRRKNIRPALRALRRGEEAPPHS